MADTSVQYDLQNLIQRFNSLTIEQLNFNEDVLNFKIIISNQEQLQAAAREVDLEAFVSLIRTYYFSLHTSKRSSDETMTNISFVLDKLLGTSKIVDILALFKSDTVRNALSQVHHEDFQLTCLKHIYRLSEENSSAWVSDENILIYLINSIASDSLSVASIASKTVSFAFSSNEDVDWFISSGSVISVITEIIKSKNQTIKFRIYELFVNLVIVHPVHVEKCETLGVFDDLFSGLDGEDILVQLNCFEILSQLASIREGFRMIQNKGLLESVGKVILSDDPFSCFLLPGAIKFFGSLAKTNASEILSKYPKVVNKIYENLQSNDPSLRILFVETISITASTSQGLKLLYENPDALKKAVSNMGKMASGFVEGDHSRRRTLDALTIIFSQDSGDVEASLICEKLYGYLDENTMFFLFSLIKQPFMELRFGALKLLLVLSRYNWIEQDMALCAGFLEYLLDRKTETEKEGHELKYEIIKTLANSSTSQENLGHGFHTNICKYAKQGPFYSESDVSVDLEMN